MALLSSVAQDMHFSQFFLQPLYLNPANAGMFDGQYRAGGMYRSQWKSVPVAYRTISLMADTRFDNFFAPKTDAGAGFIVNNDVSGDSKYTITQFYIPVSCIKTMKSDSNLSASFGLVPGFSSIGFNTGKLTYDSQFDGDIYNPSLPTGESYPSLSRNYFDVAAGLILKYKIKNTGFITFGTSLSHFNRPRVSFFKNNDIRLYSKSSTFLSVNYPFSQLFSLNADLMYARQGPFRETLMALRASYVLDIKDHIAVNAGISNRFGDAAIFMLGMEYKNYTFGFAYDFNYSNFQAATNKRGAIELGLIYIFKKETPFLAKKRVCPIYM
jgi:type IX secretion system PorP/SprF family membrane protein